VVLIGVGLVIGGYGAVLVWENPPVIIIRIVVWALVGVVLHDAVFAPLCVALGFTGRRLIPGRWWPPVAVAAFCSVVLVFLAIPVYGKPGMRPDNMTVLDRNYPLGLDFACDRVGLCAAVLPNNGGAPSYWRRPQGQTLFTALASSSTPGLLIIVAAGLSAALVSISAIALRHLPVRQNEVVEQERADDVERQPPAV
jgi:hypothetical protein